MVSSASFDSPEGKKARALPHIQAGGLESILFVLHAASLSKVSWGSGAQGRLLPEEDEVLLSPIMGSQGQ